MLPMYHLVYTPLYHPGYTIPPPTLATVASRHARQDGHTALRGEVTELNISDGLLTVRPPVSLSDTRFTVGLVLAVPV